ncbi:ATP-binding cassette domain-containing protein [Dehalogenimonas etheniformans]|uniref:ABC transporter ATP-binding protein n=1 Tax=Dehalogenimonas etheniformans TaxID=1536648 RepID=A0A2P5P6L9_9CHLR|nr:ATP-binding cassette domain-containing protein [Dehalogenimonas etheniformans]PPD57943.1 ABC transporter ATP-binding protein [Dehalogenimonas etheniformans]QNT75294.1 ATP-binding cassette domain-containing protein [Dehalogenimonas etheniformans]
MSEETNSENVIEVKDLTRKFKTLTAVDSISFDVKKGEVFGFLGPNGAGKTTTINMLCTLFRPTSGKATVAGYDVDSQTDLVRASIGLVFQDTTLDDYMTAEQNLRFHALAYGVPPEVRDSRLKSLMEMVELWPRRKDRTRTYSGGMRRRLEIARGLLHQPKVLFLDEPTIGLDPQTRNKIWGYIHELRKQIGLTIFMTTHYMDEADLNCDRIGIIDHGKIIALDTPTCLKDAVGGDVITLRTTDNSAALEEIRRRYNIEALAKNDQVTFSVQGGETFLPEFVKSFSGQIQGISLRRPTLDDVFLKYTGREIRSEEMSPMDAMKARHTAWMGRRR